MDGVDLIHPIAICGWFCADNPVLRFTIKVNHQKMNFCLITTSPKHLRRFESEAIIGFATTGAAAPA